MGKVSDIRSLPGTPTRTADVERSLFLSTHVNQRHRFLVGYARDALSKRNYSDRMVSNEHLLFATGEPHDYKVHDCDGVTVCVFDRGPKVSSVRFNLTNE